MKFIRTLPALMLFVTPITSIAQETTTGSAGAQIAMSPEVDACRASGLIALKERS